MHTNLSRSFPELKYDEIRKTAKEFYGYLIDVLFETLWSLSAAPEAIARGFDIPVQIEFYSAR